MNDAQKKDFQAIVKMVDGPATGQPASNDIGLTWVQNDLLKAQGNMQFVPFTVSVDASKLATKTMSLYWRVVSKNPPAEGDKKKKKGYAYEDLATVPLEGASGLTTRQPLVHRTRRVLRPDHRGQGRDVEGKERACAEDRNDSPAARDSGSVERRVHHEHGHRGQGHRAVAGAADARAAGRPSVRDGGYGNRAGA